MKIKSTGADADTACKMLRKQGFPMNNCNIKMPDNMSGLESVQLDDDGEQLQRRQQLINFAHAQWGFNNWSWSVTKQDLDFVDFSNGKYCAGVAAFVSVTVKTFDIHRENIGYATSVAHNKGLAIWKSRKCAVTNALRETLLSFGGNVAAELIEALESNKSEAHTGTAAANGDPDCAATTPAVKPVAEVKNALGKGQTSAANSVRPPLQAPKNAAPIPVAPAPCLPPAANRPPPANAPRPPAPPGPPAPLTRPNSNEECGVAGAGAGPGPLDEGDAARAERKRRQRAAQEEFRRQMAKQKNEHDEKQDVSKGHSFDSLLRDLPTQDIEIEETGNSGGEATKRRSPTAAATDSAKKRASRNRLDFVID